MVDNEDIECSTFDDWEEAMDTDDCSSCESLRMDLDAQTGDVEFFKKSYEDQIQELKNFKEKKCQHGKMHLENICKDCMKWLSSFIKVSVLQRFKGYIPVEGTNTQDVLNILDGMIDIENKTLKARSLQPVSKV